MKSPNKMGRNPDGSTSTPRDVSEKVRTQVELFPTDGAHSASRQPKDLTNATLQLKCRAAIDKGEATENRLTPLKAVRAKCLDCCCLQHAEVRKCVVQTCALWPYRMGHRPDGSTPGLGGVHGKKRALAGLFPTDGAS
jgi:hypothetical protein